MSKLTKRYNCSECTKRWTYPNYRIIVFKRNKKMFKTPNCHIRPYFVSPLYILHLSAQIGPTTGKQK